MLADHFNCALIPVCLPYVYVYRSCMYTVRVCIQFVYIYCSCMYTTRACPHFMCVYRFVYLTFVHIYSLCLSTVSVCLLFVYVYPSYLNVYNFQNYSNNFFLTNIGDQNLQNIYSRLSSGVRRGDLVAPCSAGPHAGDDV